MTTTAGRVLAQVLRAAGVDAVYGAPLLGVDVVSAPTGVAALLATAHERVHRVTAGVHLGGGHLRIGRPTSCRSITVDSVDDLVAAAPVIALAARTEGCELRAELSLDQIVPERPIAEPSLPSPWQPAAQSTVDALAEARCPIVLAGPGVVRARAVPGLHALAAVGSLGVLNTWGAKGVFDWRSRHHLATIGLQALDYQLGGVGDADLIIAIGVDLDEAPAARWQLGPVLEVAPDTLASLSQQWARPRADIVFPALRGGLAAVTREGWSMSGALVAPTRVTRHYSQCFGTGGLVAADPGVAGYWVARTFSTTELGTVHVPASADVAGGAGTAAACALVARLRQPSRPVLAVVDGPLDARVSEVLDVAGRLGIAFGVEVWAEDGEVVGPDAHLDRLRMLAFSDRPGVVSLATDPGQLARMIDIAGPIIAWPEVG